jgi:hypothetical protein
MSHDLEETGHDVLVKWVSVLQRFSDDSSVNIIVLPTLYNKDSCSFVTELPNFTVVLAGFKAEASAVRER